jgi:RNA recognition motif-containing protein
MASKLYVGNLAHGVTEAELTTLFEAHGKVRLAQIIVDRDTGQSRGFAFVEMGTEEEAHAATQALDGRELNGRKLTVNEARAKSGGGGPGRRF